MISDYQGSVWGQVGPPVTIVDAACCNAAFGFQGLNMWSHEKRQDCLHSQLAITYGGPVGDHIFLNTDPFITISMPKCITQDSNHYQANVKWLTLASSLISDVCGMLHAWAPCNALHNKRDHLQLQTRSWNQLRHHREKCLVSCLSWSSRHWFSVIRTCLSIRYCLTKSHKSRTYTIPGHPRHQI